MRGPFSEVNGGLHLHRASWPPLVSSRACEGLVPARLLDRCFRWTWKSQLDCLNLIKWGVGGGYHFPQSPLSKTILSRLMCCDHTSLLQGLALLVDCRKDSRVDSAAGPWQYHRWSSPRFLETGRGGRVEFPHEEKFGQTGSRELLLSNTCLKLFLTLNGLSLSGIWFSRC